MYEALRLVWSASDFDSALSRALAAVCRTLGWCFAEAWVPDRTDSMLTLSASWFSTEARYRGFREEGVTMLTPKGVGLCGRVWASRQTEWIPDVTSVALEEFLRSERAAQFGLRGAYAVPIATRARVVTILIFFSSDDPGREQPDVDATAAALVEVANALRAKVRDAEAAARQRALILDSQTVAVRELMRQVVGDVIPLLSAITGWSERLGQEVRTLTRQSRRSDAITTGAQAITAAARRARGLLRRVEPLLENEADAEPEHVDVNEVVRSVVLALRPTAPPGTRIRVSLDRSAPPIRARRKGLERCVFCLVENAIEAVARTTDARGEVFVKTAYRDGSIEIQVRDTGCGLTSVVAENMGSPLFTTKENGLGMGLFVARKVLASMGGKLSGEPNPDRGATFRIAVPTQQVPPAL